MFSLWGLDFHIYHLYSFFVHPSNFSTSSVSWFCHHNTYGLTSSYARVVLVRKAWNQTSILSYILQDVFLFSCWNIFRVNRYLSNSSWSFVHVYRVPYGIGTGCTDFPQDDLTGIDGNNINLPQQDSFWEETLYDIVVLLGSTSRITGTCMVNHLTKLLHSPHLDKDKVRSLNDCCQLLNIGSVQFYSGNSSGFTIGYRHSSVLGWAAGSTKPVLRQLVLHVKAWELEHHFYIGVVVVFYGIFYVFYVLHYESAIKTYVF